MPEETSTIDAPTKAPPKRRPKPGPPKADRLPPYNIILHDDDIHDMGEVIESIVTVTPVPARTAAKIMITAHFQGRAIVMTTHKERAELYRDRLRSRTLIATIEPAAT
jgi:ATP-dependent Clp protease adaptor protein ClpS